MELCHFHAWSDPGIGDRPGCAAGNFVYTWSSRLVGGERSLCHKGMHRPPVSEGNVVRLQTADHMRVSADGRPSATGSGGLWLTRRLLLAGGIACLSGLAACSDSGNPEPASGKTAETASPSNDDAPPRRMRIALVMKTLTNPFFIAMEEGARKAAAERNVDLIVRTAAEETSIEQQISIVGEMIDLPVDALVIAPGDSVQLLPILKTAADRGITLVNIDNRLDPSFASRLGLGNIPFISVDNERGAYEAARYLAGTVPTPAKAAILEGIRTASNAQARFDGARRAFAEAPGVDLIAHESANWKIDEGYAVTAQLMRDHPDLALLYCANDMMALGAIRRLSEIRRTDVSVGGFDALTEAITAMQEGRMRVTVDQDAARQGYLGVDHAVRMMAGETVPGETLVPARLVTTNDFPNSAR